MRIDLSFVKDALILGVKKMDQMRSKALSLYQRRVFQNVLWLLFSRTANLFLQMGYFVIVARILGARDYGIFVGITAMASLFINFASFGSGDILIKHVSNDKSIFAKCWGNALKTTVFFSFILVSICLLTVSFFLHEKISILSAFLILFSDLLLLSLIDVSYKAFTALDVIHRVAHIQIFYGFSKLIAAFIFLALNYSGQNLSENLSVWSWLYFMSSISTAVVAVSLVCRTLGWPEFSAPLDWRELKDGAYFAVGNSADTVNEDVDKTMLASISTLEAAGAYAAGNRLLIAAYTPVMALLNTTYMRFFKHGISGISGSSQFAKRLLPFMLAYGLLTAIGFLLFAPLITYILGSDYTETVDVLRWLSPYLMIMAVQTLAADALTGAGLQPLRSVFQLAAAALNVGLNVWLIPLYAWRGAAWATLISDGLKAVGLWIAILYLFQKEKKKTVIEN